MSLFGSLMGDFDDDIFGNHMNAMNMQMRSMNRLMNSFMPDPFNMLTNFDGGFQQNALMERQNPHQMGGLFGFPAMPNMNRLLSADIGNNGGAAFCSSSVISMSSGPDGRPQIYQATSSTKTGPGGIRETRRTVQDSLNGVKKMAIGHHIGERAHIIEKEQDLRSGQLEEHQEFINLEEDEAEDFDREFITKARGAGGRGGARAICAAPVPQQALTIEEIDDDDDVIETVPHVPIPSSSSSQHRRQLPAVPAPPQSPSSQLHQNSYSSKLTSSISSSATEMSPSSATSRNRINAGTSALYMKPTKPSSAATATESTSSTTTTTSGIDNQYLSTNPRRSTYRSAHHLTGASARRPLRTPPSSPLATTPTLHSHSTTSTPSVHPHPYNTSAARRSHHHHHHHHQHRPKQHVTKHHAASSANTNNETTAASSQPKEEENISK